jgi:hypothetical protein
MANEIVFGGSPFLEQLPAGGFGRRSSTDAGIPRTELEARKTAGLHGKPDLDPVDYRDAHRALRKEGNSAHGS